MPQMVRQTSERLIRAVQEAFPKNLYTVEKEAKSFVYSAGQQDSNIYLVEHGTVKVKTFSENGKSCITGIYPDNHFFGDSCMFQQIRRETATAMTDVRLRRLPRARFMELVASRGLVDDWSSYQARRLQEQRETITLLVTVDSVQRLAGVLLMLAEQLGLEGDNQTIIMNRFTHEDFAQMVGTTRSRIGLFLKQFQKEGMVRVSRDSYLAVSKEDLRHFLSARARQ